MGVFDEILTTAMQKNASDIHLVVDMKPLLRINTILMPAEEFPTVSNEDVDQFLKNAVGQKRYDRLMDLRDLDFSFTLSGAGRFRVNAHFQRDSLAIAFRTITADVPALDSLNLPPVVQSFVDLPRGLVLVTGVTGSGKSTTLASMVNEINHRYSKHVLTLEDPIEYEFVSDKCMIEQRELGSDVPSFASGLKHALRQDPDIILLGEMRDLETVSAAITAAETGHLVLSTLHTQNASQTIERMIDVYPAAQQNQVRSMLSNTLQAVVSQVLFKSQGASGMIPACEIMICTPAIRNCIRENRIHEIPNIIETNRAIGMCSLDESIKALVFNDQITPQQAVAMAVRPETLSRAISA